MDVMDVFVLSMSWIRVNPFTMVLLESRESVLSVA